MAAAVPLSWRALWPTRAARCFLAIWLLAALAGGALSLQRAHPLADVSHYKLWTRLVTLEGVAASYSGEYPESYAIYPPVTMYGLALVGQLYRAQVDPSFEREPALASHKLTVAIRWLALSVHLVAGAVLFALLGRWAGPWQGVVGAGLYLLNPGALWDVAVWAQPDSWHSLFALLGLWFVGRRRPATAGGWLALAAMTKPQAWAVLPLVGVALLRRVGFGGALRAGVVGAVVVGLVVLPFVVSGRLRQFLTLPERISGVMPVVSANAHNLWWLVTRGEVPFLLDSSAVMGGPISYRQAALGLFAVVLAFVLWRSWWARGPWELAGLSAYLIHAWFCVTSQAHENHAFMLFPFLCLVWWRSRFLLGVLLILIGTFSFNVLAHDFGLEPLVEQALGRWNWRLQMVASAVNVAVLGVWTGWLLRRGGGPAGAPEGPKPAAIGPSLASGAA